MEYALEMFLQKSIEVFLHFDIDIESMITSANQSSNSFTFLPQANSSSATVKSNLFCFLASFLHKKNHSSMEKSGLVVEDFGTKVMGIQEESTHITNSYEQMNK